MNRIKLKIYLCWTEDFYYFKGADFYFSLDVDGWDSRLFRRYDYEYTIYEKIHDKILKRLYK